jgi:hypothetical protein
LDEESMLASLFNSMTCYGWLFRLTAVERRLDVDGFDRFFMTLRNGFLALSPSQRHNGLRPLWACLASNAALAAWQ